MIPIAATSLPPDIARQLYALQSEIDGIADYADRVRAAETLYKSKRRTVPFRSVVAELKSLCAGVERCMYCEDSRSADIEHFRPKCFYPELTFVWTNYLNACTNCNRPKSNRFAVYAHATGQKTDLIRGGNNPVPPEPGDPVLINPRIENPLDFLFLDLRDTFEFLPSAPPGTPEYERAEYTIEILGLNDITPSVRREYYGHYYARLEQYVHWRSRGKSAGVLSKLARELQSMGHPTVWFEMKRQHQHYPELRELFEEVPEALQW